MLAFRIPFFPQPGNTTGLMDEAEEFGNNWQPGPETHTEGIDSLIADTVSNDVLTPSLGYSDTDRKVFRNTVYHTLRSRTDLEKE